MSLIIRLVDRNRREVRRIESGDLKQAILEAQDLAKKNRGLYAMVTSLRAGTDGMLTEGYVTRRLTHEKEARVRENAAADDEFFGFLSTYPEFWT